MATQEQIDNWKAQYGNVYELSTEDGKTLIIKDPLSSVMVMKKALMALQKSEEKYVESVLNDCFLAGDESILSDPAEYVADLKIQIDEFTDMPEAEIEPKGERFLLTCEGESIEIKAITLVHSHNAKRRNPGRLPLDTEIRLLELVADKDAVARLRKKPRAYIGILISLDKAVKKKSVSVRKL